MITDLSPTKMKEALTQLDQVLDRPVTLIMGGGGAMLLAHNFPLATADIDAVPKGISIDELQPYIEKVAREMLLPLDWINPWFSSFTYVLPEDFHTRLVEVFSGKWLKAQALGKDDLLIMKCFAHRKKDIAHARALVRAGANVDNVYARIEALLKRKIPGSDKAENFLNEIVDMEEA